MPKVAEELSALDVKRLAHPGGKRNVLFSVGGVPGLYMQITPMGGRSWVLRVKVGALRRDIGLGGFPGVTLSQARDKAREARDKIANGIDPVEERKATKAALVAAQRRGLTFADAVDKALTAKLDAFKNAKHRQQWENTLATYVTPDLGKMLGPVLPLARILAPLYRSGSQVYGIRLDALAVVDCDEDRPELVTAMEARFGPSPVHVTTPRGRHLYYRAYCGEKPPNLRGEGLPVDIKTGARAYVVGPWSMRADGGTYRPAKGLLGKDALPPLHPAQRPRHEAREAIPVGHRHNMLVKEAVAMVEYVDSAEELAGNLEAVRDDLCHDTETMPDSEVNAIAAWAWQRRLDNRIFRGRDSAVSLHRLALDALRRWDNETDAIALYVLLSDMHGHSPGKRFALDFKAMREAGLTRLSIPRLRAARRTLEAVGLVKLVGKHRAGSKHQTFTLARLRNQANECSGIVDIDKPASQKMAGEAGGRV